MTVSGICDSGSGGAGCEWTVIVEDTSWGDEVEWELREDGGGNILLSGGGYGNGYYDEQTVTAEGPLEFWITNDGFFGDNTPTYSVSNGTEVLVSGTLTTADTLIFSDLNCDSGTAGQTCDDAITVTDLPYTDAGNTADYGNFYSNGDVPDLAPGAVTNGTGSPFYLSGDEVVYAYTPADDEVLNISTTNDNDWIGLWAFTGCPFTSTVGYHTATSGATRSIEGLPVTAGETYYFVISTWPSPQSTDYTILIEKVGGDPDPSAYCIPEGTNANRYIDNFSTTGGTQDVSNMGSGFLSDRYGDFYVTHTVAQAHGEDVTFEVDIEGGTAGFRIWVDWNQDGVFDTTEEVAYASSGYSADHTGSFTVPADALEGDTRMRIVSHWLSSSGDIDPCETGFTYGEFEDYKFTVEAGTGGGTACEQDFAFSLD